MKPASFVPLGLPLRVFALSGAKLPEVLCGARGDICKQLHFHSAQRLAYDQRLVMHSGRREMLATAHVRFYANLPPRAISKKTTGFEDA